MTDRTDRELERRFRDGLRARAEETDTAVDLAGGARAAVSRRRRSRGTVLLAAAAVIVVALGGWLLRPGPDSTRGTPVTEPTVTDGTPVRAWRTEFWGDLRVDVPADWGYGGAPMDSAGDTVACWPVAMVDATGERLPEDDPTAPYVGRPIALTDLCAAYPFNAPDALPPKAPYVWLGAAVEPGSVDLGEGWVQETVEVNGSTLTVASDDPALRRHILDSADGGELCLSDVEPAGGSDTFPRVVGGDPEGAESLVVCAYQSDGEGASAGLTYAARLGRPAARDYLAALAEGEAPRDQCPTADYVEFEWVVLELTDGDGAVIRRDVVHLPCPGIDVGATSLRGFETVRLTPAMVEPWAVGGIPAVVSGPTGGKGAMIDSFIGLLG